MCLHIIYVSYYLVIRNKYVIIVVITQYLLLFIKYYLIACDIYIYTNIHLSPNHLELCLMCTTQKPQKPQPHGLNLECS